MPLAETTALARHNSHPSSFATAALVDSQPNYLECSPVLYRNSRAAYTENRLRTGLQTDINNPVRQQIAPTNDKPLFLKVVRHSYRRQTRTILPW